MYQNGLLFCLPVKKLIFDLSKHSWLVNIMRDFFFPFSSLCLHSHNLEWKQLLVAFKQIIIENIIKM